MFSHILNVRTLIQNDIQSQVLDTDHVIEEKQSTCTGKLPGCFFLNPTEILPSWCSSIYFFFPCCCKTNQWFHIKSVPCPC